MNKFVGVKIFISSQSVNSITVICFQLGPNQRQHGGAQASTNTEGRVKTPEEWLLILEWRK